MAPADEAMRVCAEVEVELAELRAAYEQYFLGVDRLAPSKRHDALRKRVRDLKNHFVRQTSVRFRIDNLAQKLTTFERLWDRTLKEIEAGTYKRHLFKAKLHAQARTKPVSPVTRTDNEIDDHDNFDVDEDLEGATTSPDLASALASATSTFARPTIDAPLQVPTAAKPPATLPAFKAAAAPVSATPGGLSDQKIKAIYEAYVMAKRRCGEDTSKISLNSMADTLKKQVPQLMKQHQAKSVEFKVVIKDGKAVLRALPKE